MNERTIKAIGVESTYQPYAGTRQRHKGALRCSTFGEGSKRKMKYKTLRKCIRRAKAFSRNYHTHTKFDSFTEAEIAAGGAVALALFTEGSNYERTGRSPVPPDTLDRLCIEIGLDDLDDAEHDRAMEVCFILLDLLDSDKQEIADADTLIGEAEKQTGIPRDEPIGLIWQAADGEPQAESAAICERIEEKISAAGLDVQDFVQFMEDNGAIDSVISGGEQPADDPPP